MPTQWKAKRQKVLNLSKAIIAGKQELVQLETSITVADTLQAMPMREAFKNNDKIAFAVTKVLVTRFINAFAFANKLNDAQIEVLTIDILEKFTYESLQDLVLFLKQARTGAFGVPKRGIDGSTILSEWLPKYLEQKAIAREEAYQKKKQAQNQERLQGELFVKKYQKQLADKKRKEALQSYINKLTANFDRQMLEDTITTFSKDPKLKEELKLLKLKRKEIKH